MKVLVQRVSEAQVRIEDEQYSKIQNGLLVYVCFELNDKTSLIPVVTEKLVNLRILEDQNGKMNFNVNQLGQEVLVVSQFTLSWAGQKGNRPSFEGSMPPKEARKLYNNFLSQLSSKINTDLKYGVFGADMKITSINDGPVTFFLSF